MAEQHLEAAMRVTVVFQILLVLMSASCAPAPDSDSRLERNVESSAKSRSPIAPRLKLAPAFYSDRRMPIDAAAPLIHVSKDASSQLTAAEEAFDEKVDNQFVRQSRYSTNQFNWGKWKMREVHDSEHRYSHVCIEFDGVLQFLSTGESGHAMGFFDSDDFAGDGPEWNAPPQNDLTLVWTDEGGKRTSLVVEDLTGGQGATLVLMEWTGGNHVYRVTTFIHLTPDGAISTYGPFRTSMEVTLSIRTEDGVVFEMNDNCWQGWNCSQAGSAHPVARVSLKGGKVHTCNGPLSNSEITTLMTSMSSDDNHADILSFMDLLELVYHGQLDEAQRFVREAQGSIGAYGWPEGADFATRAKWWRDLIRQLRTSTFYDLLEQEFPQLKEADELK